MLVGEISLVNDIRILDKGSIYFGNDRSILISVSAFGTLRKDLIKNIGMDRMKGFLNRYGWDLGHEDAKKALNLNLSSVEETIYYGPALHMMKGHVTVETTKLDVTNRNGKYSIHMEGIWQDSYEVVEHLKQFGKSDHPVCYTLTGYASGYLTKICKQTVIVKEVQCQAEGFDRCIWKGKSLDYWNKEEINEELQYFERKPIVEELEITYEKLLEERNNLEKSSIIYKKLSEQLLEGSNLESIVRTIYQITTIPTMIVDQTYRPLAYSGLSYKELNNINKKFQVQLSSNSHLIQSAVTKKVE